MRSHVVKVVKRDIGELLWTMHCDGFCAVDIHLLVCADGVVVGASFVDVEGIRKRGSSCDSVLLRFGFAPEIWNGMLMNTIAMTTAMATATSTTTTIDHKSPSKSSSYDAKQTIGEFVPTSLTDFESLSKVIEWIENPRRMAQYSLFK